MKLVALLILALSTSLTAQNTATPAPPENYSGMYTFLQEGEFVQVTVEDDGRVTGFVSRYENPDSDHKSFVDQFFKQGKLDGTKLIFITDTINGVRFEFTGTVDRGEGKTPNDEAYHIIKGALTDVHSAADAKTSSSSRAVVFKSFPQDAQ
jgi:hypothetical protein